MTASRINALIAPSLRLPKSVEGFDEHLKFTHKALENAATSEPDTREHEVR